MSVQPYRGPAAEYHDCLRTVLAKALPFAPPEKIDEAARAVGRLFVLQTARSVQCLSEIDRSRDYMEHLDENAYAALAYEIVVNGRPHVTRTEERQLGSKPAKVRHELHFIRFDPEGV